MNCNRVTIISIIATAILVIPLFSFAGDETVPGTPFQVLQDQIDGLQQQIDDIQIQTGRVRAYFNTDGNIRLNVENEFVQVLELNLPKGSYVSNMTLVVSAWPRVDAYLDCKYINGNGLGEDLSGDFGVSYAHPQQLAHTWTFIFEDPTMVVLTCKPLNTAPGWEYSDILHAEWTAIKADELNDQTEY